MQEAAPDHDPDCWVDDTAEEMADKIEAFVANHRQFVIAKVAEHARKAGCRIARGDREFSAALHRLSQVTRMSTAEYLLPRAIIHDDEPEALRLRDLMDMSLVSTQIDVHYDRANFDRPRVAPGDPVPSYGELPTVADQALPFDEWKRRVATCAGYQRLHAATGAVERLLEECDRVAARGCAYRCGVFGAMKQCSVCSAFYCCDSCMDGHRVMNQCLANSAATETATTSK